MPLRKMKQKKFKGIYEYYKDSDVDKAVSAYYISVRDEDNKPRKIKVDAATPEEAVAALAHYKVKRATPKLISKHKHTLETFTDLYFGQRKAVDNKREKHKFTKNVFEAIDKKRPISSICVDDLKHLQRYLDDKDFAPHYVNILVTTLSSIIKWGFGAGYVATPLPSVKKLPVDNQRQRIFSDEELEAIYASVSSKYRLFLRLMYYTAQRPKSILVLQRKDITSTEIVIRGIKKQKTHRVPISPKIKDELFAWIKDLDENDYVCSQGKKQMSYDGVVYHTKPLFMKMFNKGLEYGDKDDRMKWASLYTIRHTSLTNIYSRTGDIYLAQKLANHSTIEMTSRYTKISDDKKVNAVGVL